MSVELLRHTVPLYAIAGLLLLAGWHDLATRTLPNGVAIAVALFGIALHAVSGGLLSSLLAAAAVFAGATALWHVGGLGGGDVKLLGACALLTGAPGVPMLLVGTSIAGGILSLPYLVGRRWPPAVPSYAAHGAAHGFPSLPSRVWRAELRRIGRGGPLPYALAIGVGTLLSLTLGT